MTLMKHVLAGERPSIPAACPAGFRQLLEKAWADEPSMRPSAVELLTELDLLLQSGECNRAAGWGAVGGPQLDSRGMAEDVVYDDVGALESGVRVHIRPAHLPEVEAEVADDDTPLGPMVPLASLVAD